VTLLQLGELLLGGVAGATIAKYLRLPVWQLSGSIAGAAVAHALAGGVWTVPRWWAVVAQVLIGSAVGSTVGRQVFRDFRKMALPGTVSVVAIVGLGTGLGVLLAVGGFLDPDVAVLGMVPGGVGEMVAAAAALGADSAVVAAMHVTRLLAILSLAPLLVRWVGRRRRPDS
jgi:membrane AbrB-like protein